jgi:redox-sensitive bicupin YhaK (pirin superfamily)
MKKRIEKIIPKPAAPGMVGDGFRVFNYIPGAGIDQQRISPFLLLDFNAEIDFPASEHLRGVGVHPHKGFETVTIAYKGSVAHHDSAGNSGTIHPGDVQWMTAGAGILHKEYHDREYARTGGPFEMVQLWVNLAKKDKSVPAHYQSITKDQMGKLELPDGKGVVNVIAGNYNGTTGPAHTYTPVNVIDLKLKKGAATTSRFPAAYNTALLVVNGSVTVNNEPAAEHSFVLFAREGEEITIRATEDSVLLLLSGEPINEPIASFGPFVMNAQSEIVESIREFHAGKYGVLE